MSADMGLTDRIADLVRPICEELGLELVAVQFRRESHGQVLRVVVYHQDGISVDDCARVSREVSYLLDVEELIDTPFNLEVSSPGLDWPLTTERDFQRYLGEKITVSWHVPDGTTKQTGIIRSCSEETVVLSTDEGERQIPLDQIIKARLVIEF